VVLGLGVSCSSPTPLQRTHSSAEGAAAAVLEALAQGDRESLERLALDDAEFRDHVWPQLPAARPERNLPYSYVWGDLHQKSTIALGETLAAHGGNRYELRGVRFDGATEYRGFVVHRETTLRVRDASGGDRDLRVYGSMLEKDGQWKVFSYVVDN
jgi:hypothetical protein